jgi:hypothetical protein
VGSYIIQFVTCLTGAYASRCSTVTTSVTIAASCVTSVSLALTDQTWTISSSTGFTYQLTFSQTPSACALSSTYWSITTTSSNNLAYASSFNTISPTGLLSAGPFTDITTIGVYTVEVTSISLGGVAFTPTGTTSFVLTVVDPCLSASITTVIPAAASFYVFDAITAYSAFTSFS